MIVIMTDGSENAFAKYVKLDHKKLEIGSRVLEKHSKITEE